MEHSDLQEPRPDGLLAASLEDDQAPTLPRLLWRRRITLGAIGVAAVIVLVLACGLGRALLLHAAPSLSTAATARTATATVTPPPTPLPTTITTAGASPTTSDIPTATPLLAATATSVLVTPMPALSNEATAATPALLLVGNTYYAAWTGTDSPNHHIFVDQGTCTDVAHCVFGRAVATTDVTFANQGPSLATDGKTLYIAWRGFTNNVIYFGQFDGTNNLHRQPFVVNGTTQTTAQRPSIAWVNGKLAFSWVGIDVGNHVNVTYWSGAAYTKVITTDSSQHSPALTLYSGRLYLLFEGVDNRLHDGYEDPHNAAPPARLINGYNFGQLTNADPVAIVTNSGQYLVAWTGTNGQVSWGITTNPATFTWKGPLAITAGAGPALADAYGSTWLWWFDQATMHIHYAIIA